ncbi:F-box protein [Platanthera guangdongensis]|uniref:F-box protein n=1 Tax=Platanthera guangdongensis TaxID=2320717 RepID=A0ABR2LPG2_9ASPA
MVKWCSLGQQENAGLTPFHAGRFQRKLAKSFPTCSRRPVPTETAPDRTFNVISSRNVTVRTRIDYGRLHAIFPWDTLTQKILHRILPLECANSDLSSRPTLHTTSFVYPSSFSSSTARPRPSTILELLQPSNLARVAYVCRVWKEVASDREVREWAFSEPWKVRKLLGSPSSTGFWRYPDLNRFAISHHLFRGDTVTALTLKYSVQVEISDYRFLFGFSRSDLWMDELGVERGSCFVKNLHGEEENHPLRIWIVVFVKHYFRIEIFNA